MSEERKVVDGGLSRADVLKRGGALIGGALLGGSAS